MSSALFHLLYAICHLLFYRLRQAPSRCLVLTSLRRTSRGHPAFRHTPFAICHLLFYGLQHMPRRNLVLTSLRRISLGHYALRLITLPYAIGYMPCAVSSASAYAPSKSGPRFAAEDISKASCPSPYRSLFPNPPCAFTFAFSNSQMPSGHSLAPI